MGLLSLETAIGMTVRAALSGGFNCGDSDGKKALLQQVYLLEKPQT